MFLAIVIKICDEMVTKSNKLKNCIDNNAICGIIYPVEKFQEKEG